MLVLKDVLRPRLKPSSSGGGALFIMLTIRLTANAKNSLRRLNENIPIIYGTMHQVLGKKVL